MSDRIGTGDPSSSVLRTELESMVLGDLLGPAAGENEELTERTVRDRYLVGVLAPSRAAGPGVAPPTDDDDVETPLIPDELSEGGATPRTMAQRTRMCRWPSLTCRHRSG